MRVRLYWSMARLAHAEGRESVALDERAQGDRAPAGDRRHVPPRARAHPRRAASRSHATTPTPPRGTSTRRSSLLGTSPHAAGHCSRSRHSARASPRCAARPTTRSRSHARRSSWPATTARSTRARALRARRRARAVGDATAADDGVRARRSTCSRQQGRWRDAATACRAWGRMLREQRPRGSRRSTCSTAQPSSACARRPTARTPSVDASSSRSSRAARTHSRSRRGSRATRRARSATALFTALLDVDGRAELARAWQAPDGTVTIRADSAAGAERLRWILALDDDHSDFLRARPRRPDARPRVARAARAAARARRDRRAGAAARVLRPADRGEASRGGSSRRSSATICAGRRPSGCTSRRRRPTSPRSRRRSCARSACTRGAPPRSSGSAARSSSSGCTTSPTAAVAARLERERGLGPWSIGVVCLEGLGRYDYGLVGDLGLVKLLRALRGRPVEGWETAELLEPYGEWAGPREHVPARRLRARAAARQRARAA